MAPAGIRVAGGADAPWRARTAVERELTGEVDQRCLEAVRLLVSEVVTNSVVHAGVDADGWVSTTVSVDGAVVRIEVRDSETRVEPALRPPDRVNGGGFGLYLVDRIASSWGVDRSDGVCVWFEVEA